MNWRRDIMVKVTKIGIARGITAAYLLLKYRKEMQENYRKGDWVEATKDTAFFAVAITPVVAPNFFFGTLAPVWIGAAVGVGVTIAIVEATGIGTAEEVVDLIIDPPSPIEWYDVVAPALDQKTDEWSIAIGGWVDNRLMDVQHYLEREYQEKKSQIETGWDLLTEYGRWANPTPGIPWI